MFHRTLQVLKVLHWFNWWLVMNKQRKRERRQAGWDEKQEDQQRWEETVREREAGRWISLQIREECNKNLLFCASVAVQRRNVELTHQNQHLSYFLLLLDARLTFSFTWTVPLQHPHTHTHTDIFTHKEWLLCSAIVILLTYEQMNWNEYHTHKQGETRRERPDGERHKKCISKHSSRIGEAGKATVTYSCSAHTLKMHASNSLGTSSHRSGHAIKFTPQEQVTQAGREK